MLALNESVLGALVCPVCRPAFDTQCPRLWRLRFGCVARRRYLWLGSTRRIKTRWTARVAAARTMLRDGCPQPRCKSPPPAAARRRLPRHTKDDHAGPRPRQPAGRRAQAAYGEISAEARQLGKAEIVGIDTWEHEGADESKMTPRENARGIARGRATVPARGR